MSLSVLFLKKRYDYTSKNLENVYPVNVFQGILEKTSFVKRFDEELTESCISCPVLHWSTLDRIAWPL